MRIIKSFMLITLIGIAAVGLTVTSARAATLNVVGGQLTGATGVVVAGFGVFDVDFVVTTCFALFDDCNTISDFDFDTEAGAEAAGLALLDQVFIDSSAGNFDSDLTLTDGCAGVDPISACAIWIPFAFDEGGFAVARVVSNNNSIVFDGVGGGSRDINFTGFGDPFAKFTQVTPIPLPAALPLFLTGLAGLGLMRRRHRQA